MSFPPLTAHSSTAVVCVSGYPNNPATPHASKSTRLLPITPKKKPGVLQTSTCASVNHTGSTAFTPLAEEQKTAPCPKLKAGSTTHTATKTAQVTKKNQLLPTFKQMVADLNRFHQRGKTQQSSSEATPPEFLRYTLQKYTDLESAPSAQPKHDQPAEVWQLGCSFYALYTGQKALPWDPLLQSIHLLEAVLANLEGALTKLSKSITPPLQSPASDTEKTKKTAPRPLALSLTPEQVKKLKLRKKLLEMRTMIDGASVELMAHALFHADRSKLQPLLNQFSFLENFLLKELPTFIPTGLQPDEQKLFLDNVFIGILELLTVQIENLSKVWVALGNLPKPTNNVLEQAIWLCLRPDSHARASTAVLLATL